MEQNKMRKTTEELSDLVDAEFGGDPDAFLKNTDKWLETFRCLCIENELECAEAVGLASPMPGTNSGFTMVTFEGKDVGAGTPLFTFPPAAIDRDSVIEECAKAFDICSEDVSMKPAYVAIVLRAMKSQPTKDLRRSAIEHLEIFSHIVDR